MGVEAGCPILIWALNRPANAAMMSSQWDSFGFSSGIIIPHAEQMAEHGVPGG